MSVERDLSTLCNTSMHVFDLQHFVIFNYSQLHIGVKVKAIYENHDRKLCLDQNSSKLCLY